MEKSPISDADAANLYGIRTNHEQMPNGQLRFRLTSDDGEGYILTTAGKTGAWQKAHYHSALRETYIVELGWMAIAEEVEGDIAITIYRQNDVITTRPKIVHNVYLPSDAVIHTVKQGSTGKRDWHENPEFSVRTAMLSEKEILLMGISKVNTSATDRRFEAYIALYNNLDNLIWRIPGFLATGAAILIGFAGSVLSKDKLPKLPPVLVASLFFLVGLLFFLSAYSMIRIREHHTMAGEELARMEPEGYFHHRRMTVKRRWPPSATLVFRCAYSFLCVLFLGLAVTAVVRFDWLVKLLKWNG
jgi:hypothetical protein